MTATDDFVENLQQNKISEMNEPVRCLIDAFVAALLELQAGGGGLPNIPTNSLMGRDSPGVGPVETILLDATLSFDGSGNLRREAISGDVVIALGSNVASTVKASTTEVLTGTDASKVVTADALAALWEQGANLGDFSPITIGEGGYFHVLGSSGLLDIDFATDKAGRWAWLVFDGARTIDNNANLILPGGNPIVTAAGDSALIVSEGADVIRMLVYVRRATGVMDPASTTEVLIGTDAAKYVTPNALAALWKRGSNIASAGTISIGEGGFFHITGTTTITDIDFGTDLPGRKVWLIFDGALTLTNGANLILPTAANIVTVAGDYACFISEGGDIVRCVAYTRADGTDIAGIATQAEQETATSLVKTVSPGRQHFHPSAVKCWGMATVAAGVPTLSVSFNITSITDTALGQITWTIATDFSTANWCFQGTVERAATALTVANLRSTAIRNATRAAGTIVQECWDETAVTALAADPASWHMAGLGDQA